MASLVENMNSVELRLRALAAASAARFAGFLETAEALMAIAGESGGGRDALMVDLQHKDAIAWCSERVGKSI
jgi:hypothetical protein